jgi:hypothetical protein
MNKSFLVTASAEVSGQSFMKNVKVIAYAKTEKGAFKQVESVLKRLSPDLRWYICGRPAKDSDYAQSIYQLEDCGIG